MKVKNLRLLMLITGELPETVLEQIKQVPTNIIKEITSMYFDGLLTIQLVGTEARMYQCVCCGVMFDLDDDEEEEDITCSKCNEGPLCEDCLNNHDCEPSFFEE